MSNEITVQMSLNCSKGFIYAADESGFVQSDFEGTLIARGVQSIPTSATAIDTGTLTTAGYAYFRNVSTANFIEIGTGTGTFVPFVKLKPGEAALLRLSTTAPTARADTLAVNLQYTILSD
jgi:hypothetical protein